MLIDAGAAATIAAAVIGLLGGAAIGAATGLIGLGSMRASVTKTVADLAMVQAACQAAAAAFAQLHERVDLLKEEVDRLRAGMHEVRDRVHTAAMQAELALRKHRGG